VHGRETGAYTFDYAALMSSSPSYGLVILMGFFVGFAVKLPAVPFHSWLPDAHTEAPTAGSIVLAGLLLKTGAYGFLRFALPLFPSAVERIAPWAMALGVVGIIYGAFTAFAQRDLKRLIAYTSVSHLGFALLGIFAGGQMALQGAVIVLLAHGLSTGALFFIAGALQRRLGTRDMDAMGGLWSTAPRMGGMTMFFALASLGLPGLANFIGEFFVLVGTYRLHPALAIVASLGLVFSTVYALWIIYRVFHGPVTNEKRFADLGAVEMATLAVLVACVVWIGIRPQPVLDTARASLQRIEARRTPTARGTAAVTPVTQAVASGAAAFDASAEGRARDAGE
jgi:NADH-quinone oxidoreductase subunit M